ncbi:MAG: triosephosphate isomerase [Candidatus Yonathbacteria bacterium]|nr:triosephosphate isomerase [Candidatus Yonathbacteria bacterium]NTW47556.1 triosephosphate isomerase [Candidatus Yonathbacteria bacterium]
MQTPTSPQVKRLVVANWKMNPETKKEAEMLARMSVKIGTGLKRSELVICPPFPFLGLSAYMRMPKSISLGVQDVYPERAGARTGEVSLSMVKDMKARYVIVGHSERRAGGETDALVSKKARAVIAAGMRPIVCVGETSRDGDAKYLRILREQLLESLAGISKNNASTLIVAYEPVWAVGASVADDPHETAETILFIRKTLADMFSERIALTIPILYGGAVSDKNAAAFLAHAGVQGLLLGRSGRDSKQLAGIIKASELTPFPQI